ncbi:MAG: porin [Candidatus Latescibacterota bacterium]
MWLNVSAGAESPRLSGFIDLTYNRNLSAGESATTNLYHSFDAQTNTFLLNAAHLNASGASGDDLSYTIEVDLGSDAAVTNAGGLGTGDEIDLQEAYLVWRRPSSALGIKAGKFASYHGIEVIESGGNPTITRGFLFNLAEAYTHAGIMATWQFSPAVDLHAGLINGWDLFADNNQRPTGVLKLGYSGGDRLALTLSGYLGSEKPGETGDARLSLDATGLTKSVPGLDLWFQANYGREPAAAPDGRDAAWIGFGLQPLYHFSNAFSLGARYEYFDDADGARTGRSQLLQTFSVAPAFSLTQNLVARIEARLDLSEEKVFSDSDGKPTGHQLQAATELICSF